MKAYAFTSAELTGLCNEVYRELDEVLSDRFKAHHPESDEQALRLCLATHIALVVLLKKSSDILQATFGMQAEAITTFENAFTVSREKEGLQ